MIIQRKWAMPNKNTFLIKPIKDLLIEECKAGFWLDAFANNNTIKTIIPSLLVVTNDLNDEFKTDFNFDALDFLKFFKNKSIDGILYDPPFSVRQVSECYKKVGKKVTSDITRADFYTKLKNEITRIIKINGKVLSFGWNSGGIGKTNGFTIEKILLVAHGGIHNDTIVTIEKRIDNG